MYGDGYIIEDEIPVRRTKVTECTWCRVPSDFTAREHRAGCPEHVAVRAGDRRHAIRMWNAGFTDGENDKVQEKRYPKIRSYTLGWRMAKDH